MRKDLYGEVIMNIDELIGILTSLIIEGVEEINIINTAELGYWERPIDILLHKEDKVNYKSITLNITPNNPITIIRLKTILNFIRRYNRNLRQVK